MMYICSNWNETMSIVRKALYAFTLLNAVILHAQVQVENRDLVDVLKSNSKHPTSITDTSTNIIMGKNYISLLPVVGYAPANGFVLGAAISFSRLFDPKPTSLSSGMLNLSITSKKQFIINARSKIFLDHNKWFLQGDWRMLFFAQPTYGLGIHNIDDDRLLISFNGLNNTEAVNSAQDMRYNYVRIYEDIVRNIGNNWYVGLGYALDYHFDIKDQRLQLDTSLPHPYLTDHYAYSKLKGFNTTQYATSGIDFNILTDTRDDVANTYKGYYAALSYRVNPHFLGSSQQSTMLSYDARYYLALSNTSPRHVLAFWSWGKFLTSGNVPYLALPSIGWDTYNRSGRGYVQGRYRGLSMLYAETEYRFPISANGLLGGVLFANATFANSITQKMFDQMAPGLGAGLRVKMDKRARINLTVDIAYGRDNSSAIYFNLQETF